MTATTANSARTKIVALCGGVGGAKLALGLRELGYGERLTVVVNTGDDFEHLGLAISPDIDTVLYTLGNVSDTERGWGRAFETWSFMAALGELGGDDWFRLGDRDLATHVLRTQALCTGSTLSEITSRLAASFGIDAQVVPMSNDAVRTMIDTAAGELPFQRYFVAERCAPVVRNIHYAGADEAAIAPAVARALGDPALTAIVVCPSNPYLSIEPILHVADLRARLQRCSAPVVAVSPIVNGAALKGPAAKIMRELGVAVSATSVAQHYRGLIDGIVIDTADQAERDSIERLGIAVLATDTVMRNAADKTRLAQETLAFATGLIRQSKVAAT